MEEIVKKSREISYAWKHYYEATAPSHAWSYEEGEPYIKGREIEEACKDIYVKCLENVGKYDMPPTDYKKSEQYLERQRQWNKYRSN